MNQRIREQFSPLSQHEVTGSTARAWLTFLLILLFAASLPSLAQGKDRRGAPACQEMPTEFALTTDQGTVSVVTLDEIVPTALQPMIRTDEDSLTGIWISDIDLWTPASPLACETPKASDCPEEALEGACPDRPPTANAYSCTGSATWVNNTFALYELETGPLYALNLWRVWSQETYPSAESIRIQRPPVDYGGYSFENGVRNLNDRIYLISSMGEFETHGTGGQGLLIQLGNKISMEGQVHRSNVGTVIISESRTSTSASLIYHPTRPNQSVWKLNLRRVKKCVTAETFEQQVFPPRKKIRIKENKPRGDGDKRDD